MHAFDLKFKEGDSRICLAKDYAQLKGELQALGLDQSVVVIADARVADLYRAQLEAAIFPISSKWILIHDGEAGKTESGYLRLISELDRFNPSRKTTILAFGGGVTGDMAGFVAATMLRGLPWVQLPTSLLAMVDASVGGKVGVNTARGKNRIGAFYQPPLVYMATDTLQTLPPEELRSGIGEMVKHALIADKTAFEVFQRHGRSLNDIEHPRFAELIGRSVAVKARIVQEDERESHTRALLNFGHTVGHAIEAVAGFGQLRHGECVGLGILAELYFTCQEFSLPLEILNKTAKLLNELGLPTTISGFNVADLVAAAGYDKKIDHGIITLTQVTGIGEAQLFSYPLQNLPKLFSYFTETS